MLNAPKGWLASVKRMAVYLYDAIDHRQGCPRHAPDGRTIQPMDVAYAAEVTGRSPKYMSNAINPNEAQELTLRDFHILLLAGMDTAPLDEIERSIGRVAICVPEAREHQDLSRELMHAIKEFGDIGKQLSEALADGKVSRREFDKFDRECSEAMAAIVELREAVREVVK